MKTVKPLLLFVLGLCLVIVVINAMAEDDSTQKGTPNADANTWGPVPVQSDQSNVPGIALPAVVTQRTFAQGWDVPDRRGSEPVPGMPVEPHGSELKPRRVTAKDFYLNLVSPEKADLRYLIVKFTEESMVRWSSGRPYSKAGANLSQLNAFLNAHPDVKMGRESEETPEYLLDFWEANGERNTGQDLANMNNFYVLYFPENPDPMATIQEVIKWDIVETAWYGPLSQVCCADIAPATPNWHANQDYQEAAPTGLNHEYAWSYYPAGGPGNTGAWCFDIEYDWTEDHEDLPSDFFVYGGGDEGGVADHGDATVSIVAACNNGYGVTGGSYNVHPKGVDWFRQSGSYPNGRWVSAFNIAASYLFSGESYWIEIHYPGPDPGYSCDMGCGNCGQFAYIAVEYWDDTFAAIQTHVANGINVYEAAGNGQMNLDNGVYGNRFQRWYRDSGAVLVGAGVPGTVGAECWSNYGTRLDLSGWGDNVYASGYGDLYNPTGNRNQMYTWSFGGTSSATPIVCSAGNDLQGIAQTKYSTTLTPGQIRESLDIGATPWTGARDIGERPDLVNAINWIEPDLMPTTMSGWYSGLVPRNTTGGTQGSCPITGTLPGNVAGTYFNVAGYNWGYTPAPGNGEGGQIWTQQYVDGDYTRWYNWASVGAFANFWINDAGPDFVRGGRHSVQWYIDPADAINEYDEGDNAITEQFVWSPYQLTNNAGMTRGAPPLKDWGSPPYYNGDGFRASGGWWTGVAILPQSGNDDDLYEYADTYSSTTGFDNSYETSSAYGSGHADLVLINGNMLGFGQSRLFQGIRYSDASTSDYAIEGDLQTTISSPYTTTRTMGADDIFDIYEFYAAAGEQYYVGVTDVTGGLDLTLLDFTAGSNLYVYGSYAQRANSTGANGNEYLLVTAPTSGWHSAVVIKESSSNYGVGGNYTFTYMKPPTINLQAQNRTGWTAPIVARNTGDATITNCVFPAAIQGNTTNYINATWYNAGGGLTTSAAFENDWLLDGAFSAGFINGQTLAPFAYGERLNYNGGTIRGGRHTLTLNVDATNIVGETDEGDNSSVQQYVWSPLTLTRNVPANRAAPPAWGTGAYPNSDGFAYGIPQSFAGIAGLLSPTSTADYDCYQYTDYTGTFGGFSVYQGGSAFSQGVPDYVLVPWRIVGSGYTTYPAVMNFNGATQNVYVEADNSSGRDYNGVFSLPDPDTLLSGNIFRLYEVYLTAGTTYRFTCDVLSGTADVEMRLHRDSTQVLGRGQTVGVADAAGGGGDEQLIYTPTITDWYALVISKNASASATLTAIYNLTGALNVPAANPRPVNNLVIQWKAAPLGIKLSWTHVNQDSVGNPLHNRRYVIYRNTSTFIVPMDADSIGGTTDSTYTDLNPFGNAKNFYRVKVKSTP
jgi:hypothetical protein